MKRQACLRVGALGALLSTACGGGAPLLHPAHPLPQEHVSMGSGVSSQFVAGAAKTHIQEARDAMANGAIDSDVERDRFVTGALAHSLLAPGLAPWVSARAGLGYSTEAGLTYTARSARIDGRYALTSESFAASAGLGATGVLARPGHDPPGEARGDSDEQIPGVDAGGVSGVGFDVPLLVGWRSQASLFQLWLGGRGGYERLRGTAIIRIDPDPSLADDAPFEAERWFALGVFGVAATVHPISLALELDAGYQYGKGSIQLLDASGGRTRRNGKLDGFTITPGAAVIVHLWK